MITLDDLKRSPELVRQLDYVFDFALDRAGDHDWIRLKPEVPFVDFAGSASGDGFIAVGVGALETLPIMYVTSEGSCGRVAANLTELLALFGALPCWLELLPYAQSVDEMRRAEAYFGKRMREENEERLPRVVELLQSSLQLPTLNDPLETLQSNMHFTHCVCVAEDGYEFKSIYGASVFRDPSWMFRKPSGDEGSDDATADDEESQTDEVAKLLAMPETTEEPYVRPAFVRDLSPLTDAEKDNIRRVFGTVLWEDDSPLLLWNEIQDDGESEMMMWTPETQVEFAEATRFFEGANRRSWRTPEQLAALLSTPGPWLIRRNCNGKFDFVITADEAAHFPADDVAEEDQPPVLDDDVAKAADFTSDEALALIPRLMEAWGCDGDYLLFEPVRREAPFHDCRFDDPQA